MSREGLTKRQRVLRTLNGEEVDRRPFTFWHPFGLSHMKGDALTAAALSFAAAYGVDLLRLPTVRELPWPEQTSIDRPHDLTTLDPLSAHQGFWNERLSSLKSLIGLVDQKVAVFEPILEPWAALRYLCPREVLALAEQNHPGFLTKALETVTESLKGYAKALQTKVKIDGIVIDIESASYTERDPKAFRDLFKPHLMALLESITSQSDTFIWLQVRGQRCFLDPLLDLPHHMISWSQHDGGPAFDKLAKHRQGKLAGGIDETALNTFSYQDIRRHVDEARSAPVSLLCPGGPLSADTAPSRLKALANFLQKRDRLPRAAQAARAHPVIDEP